MSESAAIHDGWSVQDSCQQLRSRPDQTAQESVQDDHRERDSARDQGLHCVHRQFVSAEVRRHFQRQKASSQTKVQTRRQRAEVRPRSSACKVRVLGQSRRQVASSRQRLQGRPSEAQDADAETGQSQEPDLHVAVVAQQTVCRVGYMRGLPESRRRVDVRNVQNCERVWTDRFAQFVGNTVKNTKLRNL